MPKHTPRTIWKPVYSIVNAGSLVLAPPTEIFQSMRSVDADASMGLQLKRISVTVSLGNVTSGTEDNQLTSSGFMAFFKWPVDAATPTNVTMDLRNRTSLISRTPYAVMGITPRLYTVRMKSARLKLGDELWFVIVKLEEDATTTDLIFGSISQHWETQA